MLYCEQMFDLSIEPVWPDLLNFRLFGSIVEVFGNFLLAYLLLGKIYNLLRPKNNSIGPILIAENVQI